MQRICEISLHLRCAACQVLVDVTLIFSIHRTRLQRGVESVYVHAACSRVSFYLDDTEAARADSAENIRETHMPYDFPSMEPN